MKYAFVTFSILAIWISLVVVIVSLNYNDVLLPIIGLILTVILFEIGFGGKK